MNFIHPHCGPGNAINPQKSKDPIDEICRQHDINYGKLGPEAYIMFNDADRTFIEQMSKQPGIMARLYESVFRIKGATTFSSPKKMVPINSRRKQTNPKRLKAIEWYDRKWKKNPKRKRSNSGSNGSGKKYKVSYIPRNKYVGPGYKRRRKGRKTYGRKRYSSKKFNRMGTVEKIERGGHVTTTDLTQTVYIGHGVSGKRVWRAAIRALVKTLFNKAGVDVTSFDRPVVQDLRGFTGLATMFNTMRIKILYRYNNEAALTIVKDTELINAGTNVPTTTTYNTVCSDLDTDLAGISESTAATHGLHMEQAIMSMFDSATSQEVFLSSVNLRQYMMEYKISSNMVLQNITKSAIGGTDEEFLTTNIGSNPVHGKVYKQHKWLNGFNLSAQLYSAGGSVNEFYCGDVEPYFTGKSEGSSDVTMLRKPPPAWVFGCKSHKPIAMAAGGFSKVNWTWTAKISFHGFCMKLFNVVALTPAQLENGPIPFGTAQMVALESMLNNRSESVGLDISYEINQVIQCKGVEKHSATVPIINLT